MPDGAPRLASISVLGGPLHGRRAEIDPVDEITIGSDPGCTLVLEAPGVSPLHAKVAADANGARVRDTRSASGVFVNFTRAETELPLNEGDMIWVGPPEQPGSLLLQCRFVAGEPTRSEAEPMPLEPMSLGGPPPPPPAADFVVAGFAAQWPDTAAAAPPPAPAASTAEEDPFFIGEGSEPPPPPPTPAPGEKDDAFFIADDIGASPPAAALAAEPLPVPVDDFFFGEPAAPAPPAPLVTPPPAPRAEAPPAAVTLPVEEPAPPPPPAPVAPPLPPISAEPAALQPQAPAPSAPAPPSAARAPVTATQERIPARRPAPTARPAARPTARPVARGRAAAGPPLLRYAGFGTAGLVVLGILGFVGSRFLGGSARLDTIEPARARAGQTVTLTGSGFAADAKGNAVLFGDRPGSVITASATRLEVVVPEVPVMGEEAPVPVRVKAGRASSNPVDFSVLGGPTIHGISPDVAQPGEEVVLAGTGWGMGATVRFGPVPAEVLEVKDTSIRVRVPEIPGGPGTAAPAVVSLGTSSSNELPFFIGSIPLVLKVDPPSASPGDLLIIAGRGFQRDRTRDAVVVGGAFALVVSGFDSELKAVMPVVGPGEGVRPVEVRVAGFTSVGRGTVSVPPLPETVDLRFVAQPFDAVAGRDHAVLATDLGPAFVLAGAGGRTAADRAVEAQRRLNDAVAAVKATRGLTFEARGLETSPAIGLLGRPEVVLDVTDEDARAYDEDWTGLRGKGGPVTRARLARWWEAVARDLVLLLVRGEKPQFAAALAPEGRALADVFAVAQKTGRFGVAREVVTGLRPPQRDALRLVAFRVPASVTGPVAPPPVATTVASTPAAAAAPPPPANAPLRLEGTWIGSETEGDERRYLTATFRGGGGTVAYEGIVTLTVPLLSLDAPPRGNVRFSLQFKGGIRYYTGRWDGQTLSGKVARDPAGANVVGSFDLRPR